MARGTDRVEVLVVDDERVIREGMTQKLVSAGFDVRLASDGRAAFQAFLLERPDLVLLDVMMPGLDGYATCEEMRKIDREVPIVFLSALDSEQDQIRGLARATTTTKVPYRCTSADSGRNCRVVRRSRPSGDADTRLSHCNDIVTKACL